MLVVASLRVPVSPTRRRPNGALLGSGIALLVVGWVSDIGFTYGYDHQPSSTSLIPLVGPWLQLGQHYGLDGPPINTGSALADARAQQTVDTVDTANRAIRGAAWAGEIVSGLVQATGLALVIAGAITRGKRRRFPDETRPPYVSRPAPPRWNGAFSLAF